jgi:hypothetical protein
MSDLSDLTARLDTALAGARDRVTAHYQGVLHEHLERQQRLKEYEKVQARVVEIARPRLQVLADGAGDRAKVTPSVSHTRRAVTFEFRTPKAGITVTFSVAPNEAVTDAVVDYDVQIVPVLWKFDSHAEFVAPIAGFDADALARWLDDRIVGFVDLFIRINEGEMFAKEERVEDPVAKVEFPKFAAGATLEHDGKTVYFIDGTTRAEYARQHGLAGV